MQDDDIIRMLEEQLSRLDREEQAALTIGFLARNNDIARKFVRYCASGPGKPEKDHPCWDTLTDALDRIETRERTVAEREQREAFLGELERFRDDCLAGKCVECAGFEDKRRAYADGDVYFEDFQEEFIDDHGGIQEFIRYAKGADRYFRRGDHATAERAYSMLLEIYRHDVNGEHLFVVDDDFPDLDLSRVDGVDAGRLEERHKACLETRGPAMRSQEGERRTADGGG